MANNVKVFISYSHDTDAHRASVLGLCERLRNDGIDANCDQHVAEAPAQGWAHWLLEELDRANCVLVVCTETYFRRLHDREPPENGEAAGYAGALITPELYNARSKSTEFVPVLFETSDEPFIPEPLLGRTHFCLTSESAYPALCDFLRGLQSVEPCRVSPPRLPRITATTLVGREPELARLHAAWQAALDGCEPRANVITLVAWGGVGKTALLGHFLDELSAQGWPSAERVFEWSFCGQGTPERRGASADLFIKEALTFFGDADLAASNAAANDKTLRLGALLAQGRNLLVLDGLEPLQYSAGPQVGQLKDPALAALLVGLARSGGHCLCLVTTRETVVDLRRFQATTAPEWALDQLPEAAGAELLRSFGVRGLQREREALSRDVGGHALTIELLGSYLVRAHRGDNRKRDQIKFEEADAAIEGSHALKVLAAYEQWLKSGGKRGERQLALLRLMGLFDRPADPGCLKALRQAPAIPGLTDSLTELNDAAWNLVVIDLVRAGLVKASKCETTPVLGYSEKRAQLPWGQRGEPEKFLGPDSLEPDSARVLNVHPLLRAHFARQLQAERPEAFREGHRRLYEHLSTSVPYWPEGLEGLEPLYQAVAHGCQAGLHQQTCNLVYFDRIRHGPDAHSIRALGAFGADLGAIGWFFDDPWRQVSPALAAPDQDWLLNETAYCLRAVGRLREATQPMRAGLAKRVRDEEWENAAIAASDLSELTLRLGNVAEAVADAQACVEYADKSGDQFRRAATRTTLADALHQAGNCDKALELFREAETIQVQARPKLPLLYSLMGFQYCDLLLDKAERAAWLGAVDAELAESYRPVIDRAKQTLGWAKQQGWQLDVALDHLTLGRAALYLSILRPSGHNARRAATSELNAAVDVLRAAGNHDDLPRSLLSRAWLLGLEGKLDEARTDLDEAWEIAERGSMQLFMADVHLYRARLFHDAAELAEASKMITYLGYTRRNLELKDAEQEAADLEMAERETPVPGALTVSLIQSVGVVESAQLTGEREP
jgi:tetratricopeptide (TPR) repeat protein